jgi:DedD protein
MAEPLSVPPQEQQLKQRALRRLAIALGLIAAAIVGLAALDRYTASTRRVPETRPAGEPPPITALPEPAPVRPAPEAATPPEPAMPPPPPPVVGEQPTAPAPEAAPQRRGAAPPEETAGVPSAAPATRPATAPSGAAAKGSPPRAAEPAPAPAQPERIKGFVVQTGVFSSTENALALQARLKDQGIPAFVETRVVVGPFRNRAEAEAAKKRLRELGLQGLVSERK